MKPSYFAAVAAVVFAAPGFAPSRVGPFSQALGADGSPPSPVDEADAGFNGESYKMFPAKVQPVLTNLCATCHARDDHAGNFKLVRVADGFANPRETSRNVRAAAKFLTRDNPSASPLLAKAVTAHGGLKDPPLFARTHPAFKNLELWAHWASLPEGSPQPSVIAPPKPPRATGITVAQVAPAIMPPERTVPAEPAKLPPVSATPLTPAVVAENRDDPFDPAGFNRVAHPGK